MCRAPTAKRESTLKSAQRRGSTFAARPPAFTAVIIITKTSLGIQTQIHNNGLNLGEVIIGLESMKLNLLTGSNLNVTAPIRGLNPKHA